MLSGFVRFGQCPDEPAKTNERNNREEAGRLICGEFSTVVPIGPDVETSIFLDFGFLE